MVGYATVYTMFPVFSLVLDKDISGKVLPMFSGPAEPMGLGVGEVGAPHVFDRLTICFPTSFENCHKT